MQRQRRVAVTVEQCWHRVPGGTPARHEDPPALFASCAACWVLSLREGFAMAVLEAAP